MSLGYRIRDVAVEPGLALAPMEGVTDLTFRRLIRSIGGCGLVHTEFIPARNLKLSIRQALDLAMFDADEHPIAIQIYGNDPEVMAEGARIVSDLGADILDLNMGCPSKKVCQRSGGSALMKEPDLSRRIVAAMRAATPLPFTVKMRAGWDPDHRNAPEIARMCEEEGAEGLAVHWRTRTDLYGGVRELDTIRRVKASVSIPVIANGDIVDAVSALQTLEATGADGLMIGRGAMRDPWVFRQIQAALHGRPPVVVDALERKRVLLGYLEAIRPNFRDDRGVLGRFKKIARHFTDGVEGGARLRDGILHSQSLEEAVESVEAFFAEPGEVAVRAS
ncbi:MAG: tRNA-dihydrouridine synthase [Alphaproteobacteria bacterium]|nr:tRNA-dihydrouridine synthase [Alphaproteobacteria bacterium]